MIKPAEVKEAMQTMEDSVERFTQMLGELEEETSVQVLLQPFSLQ